MKADPDADLLPGEWAVLGVLERTPAHGFAVARTLAPAGELGRVWTMSRPRVYRAIEDLTARGLIAPAGTAPSERGPTRTLFEVTTAGRARLAAWLGTPVDHVREIRNDLLLKLALLDARGASPNELLEAQRARLEPVVDSLERTLRTTTGFDTVVLRYRLEATRGAIRFIDEVRAADPGLVE
jgi:DNA-binding PadR family transcriptional regulator